MPLSEDSRALLALLLGRGKSYADISGLLGIDENEVRQRAGTALAEIDPAAPAPEADLTDYLLGQADPIARADFRNRLAADPALADRAEALTDQLRLLVPGAELPDPATAEGGKPKPAPSPAAGSAEPKSAGKTSGSALNQITPHQRRLIAVLLGGALLAAVVILLLTGTFSGSDDSDEGAPEPAPTVAVLQPVDGQQGSGQVQFGFAGAEFAANLDISDLKPSGKQKGYVLWLHGSTGSFPIHAARVRQNGVIAGQIPLNEAVICLVASDFFPDLRLSLANNRDFNKAIADARVTGNEQVKLPKYTGETVLEGKISMPQAAKDRIVPICNGTSNTNN